ncbi:MAG: hypothetical protein L0177_11830 [Chloroflexi bacterium]|nr:hypothetical protein [Chloroflexota bacterium]
MASVAFRKIQAGKEASRGTAVPATKKLVGTLTMTPQIERHRPVEERGSLAEFRRSVDVSQRTSLRYEGDATFEQIVDFLLMGVKSVTSTTPSGATNARRWTFTPNLTASNGQASYTLEYGDEQQAWESSFVMVSNLELSFAMNEVVALQAELFGRFASKVSFTPSLSDPAVNEVVANKAKVWIDGAWANLGTTQKSALVTGGTIRLATGLAPVWKADGSLDFATVSEQRRHLEVELEMTMGSDFMTEYDAYVARTPRALRLQFDGPTIETTFDRYLRIDLTGQYISEPELFGDIEGENLVRLTLASHEDSSSNEFSIEAQNNVNAA